MSARGSPMEASSRGFGWECGVFGGVGAVVGMILRVGVGGEDAATGGLDEGDELADFGEGGDFGADGLESGGGLAVYLEAMIAGADGVEGGGGHAGASAADGVVGFEAAVTDGAEGRDIVGEGFIAGNDREATDVNEL